MFICGSKCDASYWFPFKNVLSEFHFRFQAHVRTIILPVPVKCLCYRFMYYYQTVGSWWFHKQNFRHKIKHWWKIYSLTVWLLKLLKNHLVIKELNFYLTTSYVCAIRALHYDRSVVLHSICKCGICYKVTFVKFIRKYDSVRCYLRLAVGVNVCIL